MSYQPLNNRYDRMLYRRAGQSGLILPSVSLGLWHNFGDSSNLKNCKEMVHRAFDLGITHFDLANNYGPPPGAAEEMFGRMLASDLKPYRDELIISTKAGYDMWPGPYGNFGSRKYLIASLDQSLRRMGLDYVDIYYHHRLDPDTPLEETMGALAHLVKAGKALYVGVSNYGQDEMRKASAILRDLGAPLLVNQVKYNMFERRIEDGLILAAEEEGVGLVIFSPLAQGVLTDRYLRGIPEGSRAKGHSIFLLADDITEEKTDKVRRLSYLAQGRGQSVASLALAFVLRHPSVTSVIVGASTPEQVLDSVKSVDNLSISLEELAQIETILG